MFERRMEGFVPSQLELIKERELHVYSYSKCSVGDSVFWLERSFTYGVRRGSAWLGWSGEGRLGRRRKGWVRRSGEGSAGPLTFRLYVH
jgi:hypothetical protein